MREPDDILPREPTRFERVQAAALAHLADDEAELLDYAAELRQDRDTYKALVVVLMGGLHDATRTIERQRDTIVRLNETIRKYIGASDERRAA